MEAKERWQRKYDWRITWPGEGFEDWSAYDGKIYIGRVMRDLTTHSRKNMFLWSGGGSGARMNHRLMPHQGWCEEHWQAAQAVEDWWIRMLAANGR